MSHFWKEIFRLHGSQLHMSNAYHPQSDGQTVVVNRCLENYLRAICGDFPSKWVKCLPWAEWWYNTCFHSSIGMPPFQIVYDRSPPVIADYIQGNTQLPAEWISSRDLLKTIKDNLLRAQTRMKHQADKHRRDKEFSIGSCLCQTTPLPSTFHSTYSTQII